MPAESEAQRRYLYARFGAAWVKAHDFDNPGKLPAHVKKPRNDAVTQALAKRRP